MKIKDIRQMALSELNEKLKELEMELIKQNAQLATGTTPKSPGMIRSTKKTIARIRTILAEKSKKPVEAKK